MSLPSLSRKGYHCASCESMTPRYEVFQNGCIVGMLVLAGCVRERGERCCPRAPVILISIATLRADHLPAWGYRGVRTPSIDGLAAIRALATRERTFRSHCRLTFRCSRVSCLRGTASETYRLPFRRLEHPTILGPPAARLCNRCRRLRVRAPRLHGPRSGLHFFDDGIVLQGGTLKGNCSARQ